MEKLSDIALQALQIEKDIYYRFKKRESTLEDFEMYTFEQVWGNTTGAFGGVGGCAMTTQRTWVFIPVTADDNCFIYFNGRYGYDVPYSQILVKDLREHNIAPVSGKGKYRIKGE